MPLDYTWSLDPVFPVAVFAHPLAGPLLAGAGWHYAHPANHIPAWRSRDTVAAMLRLEPALLDLLAPTQVSFAPHAVAQEPGALESRAAWAVERLTPLAHIAQREEWDQAAMATVIAQVQTAATAALRHTLPGPTGPLPDMARLAPYFGAPPEPFCVSTALQALVGADPTPWVAPSAAQDTLAATALSYGLPTTLRAQLEQAAPDLLEGAILHVDGASAVLSFSKAQARIQIEVTAAPMDGDRLRAGLAGNALLPEPRPSLAHMVQIRARLTMAEGAALDSASARMLLRTVAAFEGPGSLVGQPGVFFPSGWIAAQIKQAPGWPVGALAGTRLLPEGGVATQGLAPLLGTEFAYHSPHASAPEQARVLFALAGWVADHAPALQAGDTIGDGQEPRYAITAATPAWLAFGPAPHARPRWAKARAKAGRMAPLLAATDPHTPWRPAWARARHAAKRLDRLVVQATPSPPRAPTFCAPLLP